MRNESPEKVRNPGIAVVSGQWTDLDQFSRSLSNLNLDLQQLSRGPQLVEAAMIQVGRLAVFSASSLGDLYVRGQRGPSAGWISVISNTATQSTFRGRHLPLGSVLSMEPNGEIYQRTGENFASVSLLVPDDLARSASAAMYGGKLDPMIGVYQVFRSDPRTVDQLSRAVASVVTDPHSCDPIETEGNLLDLMLATLDQSHPVNLDSTTLTARRLIVRKTDELFRSNLSKVWSAFALCKELGICRRSLFYAFQEQFSVTPMAYGKMLRLNAAHAELKRQGRGARVNEVARLFGFRHPGQFAIDYSLAYGESPSETASKPSRFQSSAPVLRFPPFQ